uniref:Uncharacterized protein n=1 Tax=uncultured prokaryote TaxID=198431 RepID=A0A0H5Q7N2_9ZZZZ|nr:hypothetical protein [uncultured prokaryote]
MKKLLFLILGGACLHANAAGYVENRGVYATNPNNQFGQEKTITVDGDPSDWTQDMMIAQGGANDMCTTFYGQHENCVRDCYSLYAAWDDANLYLAWQMVNVADVRDDVRDGDGPLSDGGRIGEAPLSPMSMQPRRSPSPIRAKKSSPSNTSYTAISKVQHGCRKRENGRTTITSVLGN